VAERADAEIDVADVEMLGAGGDELHARLADREPSGVAEELAGAASRRAGAQLEVRQHARPEVDRGRSHPRRAGGRQRADLAAEISADEEQPAVRDRKRLVKAEDGHVAGRAERIGAVAREQARRSPDERYFELVGELRLRRLARTRRSG
jgi:hypothetical protein